MITYDSIQSEAELQQILDLQTRNLPDKISLEEKSAEGFVTIRHDLAILKAMNAPYPHVVARSNGQIVGFALVMLRQFERKIPFLIPMFELINSLEYKGKILGDSNYFIMGQICIEKAFRGKGIFGGLYHALRRQMIPHFPMIITEVASKNSRSIRAHEKVGFQNIKTYSTEDGEEWKVLLWDWEKDQSDD